MWGGISDRELGCAVLFVAIVGGALCIGGEHIAVWLWHHVIVGWK